MLGLSDTSATVHGSVPHLVDLVVAEELLRMCFARSSRAVLALHIGVAAVRRRVLGLLGRLVEGRHVGIGEQVQPALDVLGAYQVVACMAAPLESPGCKAPLPVPWRAACTYPGVQWLSYREIASFQEVFTNGTTLYHWCP